MEAIGRLAGGVAHDFNNVLTAIFGYSDLLLDQFGRDDPRRADVEEIRRSAQRAATLTRQLLAFSRKQMMQPRIINLNDVLTDLKGLLSRLLGEHIRLELRLGPEPWTVRADPGQIEQVVINLCANARDAMPDGGTIEIATENVLLEGGDTPLADGLPDGPYVRMTVADEGHGMSERVRQHIFEPFFTTKEHGKGTGLGLATAYGIIRQSDGGISAQSEEGRGSRFFVFLPRVDPVNTPP
jgi:signal transduction histidine kinase